MAVPDRIGRAGEIKGSGSRSCLHVASLVIKLKRGWGCVCVRAGVVLKMKMAHVAALFFLLLTVAEGRAHQRGGERRECAETRGTAVDLLIRERAALQSGAYSLA